MDWDAEYDNRARVAGSAGIIAGWARDAARFRDAHPPRLVPYGPGAREAMDLFLPPGGAYRGAALLIHGGYWMALGREWDSHWAAGLLARGVAVALPSYDLCPGATIGGIGAQMERAALALSSRLGTGLLAMGHSAGGHLAAWLLARSPVVGAAVAVSGVFDLAPLRRTKLQAALRLRQLAAAATFRIGSWKPELPVLLLASRQDRMVSVDCSRAIARAWGAAIVEHPTAGHDLSADDPDEPDHPLTARAAKLAWQSCDPVMNASTFKHRRGDR